MHRPFLLAIFFSLALFSAAQQDSTNIDSLRAVMQSKRPYQDQINAAIQLVQSYQTRNFDSAIIEGNKAIALARKHTDSISVAELKHRIGVASYFEGKYDVAIDS